MIFNVIGILVGLAILVGGLYYLVKEKHDKESKKIYSVISIVGALILIGMVIKLFMQQ